MEEGESMVGFGGRQSHIKQEREREKMMKKIDAMRWKGMNECKRE